MKRLMASAFAVLLLFAAVLIVFRTFAQQRVIRRIAITSQEGINSLEKIRLGGTDQWILIRGWDRTKPLLLFLHGGPGFPQMPFARMNSGLEKEFVVVHWDQRNAGKSYPAPGGSMNVEQFEADAHELCRTLLQRFGAPKLFLVAHSWGSMIGALIAARHPELFYAYVGISQFANAPESEKLMYQFALETATNTSNSRAIRDLRKLGPPPYESMSDFETMKRWVAKFGKGDDSDISRWKFAHLALGSPVYSWADLARIPLGVRSSFNQLWRETFYKIDLFKQARRIDVPVYLISGRHDRLVTASAEMATRYFELLDAPNGKQQIWFENSGHWPHMDEPGKYRDVLIHTVLKQVPKESNSPPHLQR